MIDWADWLIVLSFKIPVTEAELFGPVAFVITVASLIVELLPPPEGVKEKPFTKALALPVPVVTVVGVPLLLGELLVITGGVMMGRPIKFSKLTPRRLGLAMITSRK